MRSRRAPLAILAIVALAASACGGASGSGDDRATGGDEKEPTAWEQVLDGITDDGTVPKETALQAFSLVIATLPGVDVPDGPVEPVPSGSGAVRWLLRYHDDLTPAQREAVDAVLTPTATAAGGPGMRAGAGPSECDGEKALAYDSMVKQAATDIAGKLNRGLTAKLSICVDTVQTVNEKDLQGQAYAVPHDAQGGQTGALASCTVHITPIGALGALPPEQVRANLSHELMHCFAFELLGVGAALALPPWVGEGIPAWVGEVLVGGTAQSVNWWKRYLTQPGKALFSRSYDAIGLYSHMDETGADPWPLIDPMLQAGTGAFGVAIAPGGDAFLDSWPSGYARDPSLGPAWDTTGPGITGDTPPTIFNAVPNGATVNDSVDAGANSLSTVDLQADVVQVQLPVGFGLVRFADGEERRLADVVGRNLCTRPGGCECPEGSVSVGAAFEPAAGGDARVAFTGGGDSANIAVAGLSLDDFCQQEPNDDAPPVVAGLDQCLVGTWSSTSFKPAVGGGFAGAAEVTYEGGAGAVLTVKKDGAASINFDPMGPVRGTLVANGEPLGTTQIAFTGQVAGTMSTSGNQVFSLGITSNTWAYEGLAETDFGAFPFSGDVAPQAAVGSFEATYTCSPTTFDFTITGEQASTGSIWARQM